MSESPYPGVERRWAARVRAGDVRALEEMHAAHGARLCAYVRRWTGEPAIAEEMVQEVFLAIWRARERWTIDESMIKAYLYRAARNRITNHLRHRQVALRYEERSGPDGYHTLMGRPEPTPEELLQQRELRRSVQQAVNGLPDRCREIFLLNREQGLSYVEIAGFLGVTVKTVEYHMGRAFVALRRELVGWSSEGAERIG